LPRYYLQSAVEPYYVGRLTDGGSGCSPYDTAQVRNHPDAIGVANDGFRNDYPANYDHNWENE